MIKGGKGGAKTKTGLIFESRIALEKAISSLSGYKVSGDDVYFRNSKVAELYQKK